MLKFPDASVLPEVDGDQPLPVYLNYKDLRKANIVRNWQTLSHLIDTKDFPPGILIGSRRCWTVEELKAWLESQPTARKIPPLATKPRGRKSKKIQAEVAA